MPFHSYTLIRLGHPLPLDHDPLDLFISPSFETSDSVSKEI